MAGSRDTANEGIINPGSRFHIPIYSSSLGFVSLTPKYDFLVLSSRDQKALQNFFQGEFDRIYPYLAKGEDFYLLPIPVPDEVPPLFFQYIIPYISTHPRKLKICFITNIPEVEDIVKNLGRKRHILLQYPLEPGPVNNSDSCMVYDVSVNRKGALKRGVDLLAGWGQGKQNPLFADEIKSRLEALREQRREIIKIMVISGLLGAMFGLVTALGIIFALPSMGLSMIPMAIVVPFLFGAGGLATGLISGSIAGKVLQIIRDRASPVANGQPNLLQSNSSSSRIRNSLDGAPAESAKSHATNTSVPSIFNACLNPCNWFKKPSPAKLATASQKQEQEEENACFPFC